MLYDAVMKAQLFSESQFNSYRRHLAPCFVELAEAIPSVLTAQMNSSEEDSVSFRESMHFQVLLQNGEWHHSINEIQPLFLSPPLVSDLSYDVILHLKIE